jgi:hypothetical protein
VDAGRSVRWERRRWERWEEMKRGRRMEP